jgi:hypothetical protein
MSDLAPAPPGAAAAVPTIHPLQGIAGIPESTLSNAVAALLPATSARAPWDTVADAVFWVHRAAPGAADALAPELRGRPTIPLTIGAFIRYAQTPVGSYGEILAAPVLLAEAPLPPSSIPFIAVDSIPSIHGGRTEWSLPKTLARFTFGVGSASAVGDGWRVDARIQARPRPIPLALELRNRQALPGGGSAVVGISVRARAHVGRVSLAVEGPTLPDWLLPGPHLAFALPGARMTFGVPS